MNYKNDHAKLLKIVSGRANNNFAFSVHGHLTYLNI